LACRRQGRPTIASWRSISTFPHQITAWKSQLEGSAPSFDQAGTPARLPIDVKSLHAKIGELTLENDFLEERYQAGLLSAKR